MLFVEEEENIKKIEFMENLSAKVIQIAAGRVKFLGKNAEGKDVHSAFEKGRMREAKVSKLGIEGDNQGNTKTHGGVDRALCHYAAQNYAELSSHFGSLDTFKAGGFGENIATKTSALNT